MDFYEIKQRSLKKGVTEVYPDFQVDDSRDLMIKGGTFYAVWDEETKLWSTNEYDLRRLIDNDLYEFKKKMQTKDDEIVHLRTLRNYSSNSWRELKSFIRDAPDNYHILDNELCWQNTKTEKRDYISKKLPYELSEGPCDAWEELVSTLYDEEERTKIEWAIGSIVTGQSRKIQKFIVLYGEAGAGKSTILNIVQDLFDGYYATFNAKALTASSSSFSTAPFKKNPLVAIQHDGDLSRIEDNTLLNSIVSHEEILVNDKYERAYPARVNCMLFMATNKPVKITDAKSGIIRRLIDVRPSGRHLPPDRYFELMDRVKFELGQIASHCREVYLSLGKNYYATYRPIDMMYKTDVFYNFVEYNYDEFKDCDGLPLKRAYNMYKSYCNDYLDGKPEPMYKFREALKDYFDNFEELVYVDGQQKRKYYSRFKAEKFDKPEPKASKKKTESWIKLKRGKSIFDEECKDCLAQLATQEDKPSFKWDNVKTYLKDIDTSKVHYVKVPLHHIVLDFDIKVNGEKSLEKNIEEASKFPPTYAEVSKSGKGLHLHYIFDGNVRELMPLIKDDVEVKVFTGKSSLRRQLSMCNDISIAHISSGLPLKGEKKVLDSKSVEDEKHLRALIAKALNKSDPDPKKRIHADTASNVNFIHKALEEAYNSDISYDVSDLYDPILTFAKNSTHQKDNCLRKVLDMKFQSKDFENKEEHAGAEYDPSAPIVIFDVEVFPNLLVICYTEVENGKAKNPKSMINPSPREVEKLFSYRLIGFNNRKYDNHILYARSLGKSLEDIYDLSKRIIDKESGSYYSNASNLSYTDIYDFASEKKSLKKWEIDLGIHHQELGLKWDEPVPENLWPTVVKYCMNDVYATVAVWNELQADFAARKILASWANQYIPSTVNDTTNTLTARIMFAGNSSPQDQFNYRNLGELPEEYYILDTHTFKKTKCTMREDELIEKGIYNVFDLEGRPIFPGYRFDRFAIKNKSSYRGEFVGEGGYVFATKGMYWLIDLLDVSSMHPSSVNAENLFGEYTQRYKDILMLRLHIKHKEFDKARKLFDGAFAEYLNDEKMAKSLSNALKIAINSVYGLTSASFKNAFKDPRNIDNIVAKRGELFMINLKHEVMDRGFTVAHIKTDSIKIPNATPEILEFVCRYGKEYGYSFEHEQQYDRMCLVNNAVYIAKYSDNKEINGDKSGSWTATGAQFQHPYVFKKLFSKQDLEFDDLCETKSVQTAIYIDMNESLGPDEHNYIFVGKTGAFCPIKDGCGGGILLREKEGSYSAVTGTKGYRWLESETVKNLSKENDINYEYFDVLTKDAKDAISEYGDFEQFVSDDLYLDITSDKSTF